MTWRDAGRTLRGGGMALVLGAIATLAQPASAQSNYERKLAGIKLNSTSSAVLRAFGNPNEVVIGDVGIRQAPLAGGGGQAGAGGQAEGGFSGGGLSSGSSFGGGSGGPSFGGKRGGGALTSSGPPAGYGGGSSFSGGGGGALTSSGPPAGYGGGSSYSGRGSSGPSFGGSQSDELPGGGGSGGYSGRGSGSIGGGSGGGVGQFGQTTSTLARTQEVTWIYNRKIGNNLVSYEFLIGPGGQVSQIRVSGYSGGNSRTARSIALGNTYKDVVRAYGFPEEHYQVGSILVASYKKRAHVQFQFLNERGTANQNLNGNKVVAITVAAIE